jgi:cytochrome c553
MEIAAAAMAAAKEKATAAAAAATAAVDRRDLEALRAEVAGLTKLEPVRKCYKYPSTHSPTPAAPNVQRVCHPRALNVLNTPDIPRLSTQSPPT